MPQGTIDVTLDPLASPLRRPRVARALTWTLGILLAFASLLVCTVVGGLGSAATGVFVRALALSSAMSLLPILILWYLDRRERESPYAYAAAFLWGGLIATTVALPLNTAAIMAVTQWLEQFPELGQRLGPDAAMMIGAPGSTICSARALSWRVRLCRLRFSSSSTLACCFSGCCMASSTTCATGSFTAR